MIRNIGGAEQLFNECQKKIRKSKSEISTREFYQYYHKVSQLINQEISDGGSSLVTKIAEGIIPEQEIDFLTKTALTNLFCLRKGYKEYQVKYKENLFTPFGSILLTEPGTGKVLELDVSDAYISTSGFLPYPSKMAASLIASIKKQPSKSSGQVPNYVIDKGVNIPIEGPENTSGKQLSASTSGSKSIAEERKVPSEEIKMRDRIKELKDEISRLEETKTRLEKQKEEQEKIISDSEKRRKELEYIIYAKRRQFSLLREDEDLQEELKHERTAALRYYKDREEICDNVRTLQGDLYEKLNQIKDELDNIMNERNGEICNRLEDWRSSLYRQKYKPLASLYQSFYNVNAKLQKEAVTGITQNEEETPDDQIRRYARNINSLLNRFRDCLSNLGILTYEPKPGDVFEETIHLTNDMQEDLDSPVVEYCETPGVRLGNENIENSEILAQAVVRLTSADGDSVEEEPGQIQPNLNQQQEYNYDND